MQISNLPATKLAVPFASSAGGGYIRTIPQASQIGITDGAASLTDGFPPLNFQPVGSGGVPPDGRDMNGILNEITAWTRWQNAGGLVPYDSAFSTAIGGYPQGALVAGTTAGLVYLNTVDNNTTNPNASGAGWIPVATSASVQSGQYLYAVAGGTANTLTATLAPALANYSAGFAFDLLITTTNTAAAGVNVSGFGVRNIVNANGQPTQAGDLQAGRIVSLVYDGTNFQLLSPPSATGFTNLIVLTTSGTWTVPAGVYLIRAWVIGAGGGGGSSQNNDPAAGGGGNGCGMRTIRVTPGQTFPFTLGAGGSGGSSQGSGAAGGATSGFGMSITGAGGGAGQSTAIGSRGGGQPGVVSGADISFPGQSGSLVAGQTSVSPGGAGGNAGGPYGGKGGVGGGSVGGFATGYGGGGGGAGFSIAVGGGGAQGAIYVEY